MNLVKLFTFFLLPPFFWACTSPNDEGGFAGGTTEDAGIVAELNVAGLTQKGPFAKGSAVTVQGVDCRTMQLTNEKFEGSVESDKGDFTVKNVKLSSTCAVLEVSGYYLSEISGKRTTDKLALRALTDLRDRKTVNVNLLTHLEYERVMYLVTEKNVEFAKAKMQAEKEVLAAFEIEGKFEEFENLNIFESGDGNAALLAVSVMMQGGADVEGLAERVDKFDDSFAESGVWNDSRTKSAITEWASSAAASGELETIRKNVKEWGFAAEVPTFEKYVEKFGADLASEETSSGLYDSRDGQRYRTVRIGNQEWMAENLNYAYLQPTKGLDSSSFCYNGSVENCTKYGRLYTWSAAMDSVGVFSSGGKGCGYGRTCTRTNPVQGVCPSGWHLPTQAEWDTLFVTVGGVAAAGKALKTTTGWKVDSSQTSNGNGDDTFGFSMLPAGVQYTTSVYSGILENTSFWSSTECNSVDCGTLLPARGGAYYAGFSLGGTAYTSTVDKDQGFSVRCVMDVPDASAEVVPAFVDYFPPCKTDGLDTCKYGILTDERDGQTYKTVKIGELEWMAENLNFAYLQSTGDLDSSSFCYNDSAENCTKYGRLYTWSAAMDSVGMFSTDGAGCGYGDICWLATDVVRGVCPEGWHLPYDAEWYYLFDGIYGIYSIAANREWPTAGRGLKSTTGWKDDGNGSDAYGFSVLPVGFRSYTDGSYTSEGDYARFWSPGDNKTSANALSLVYANDSAHFDVSHKKNDAYSVRCVKNWNVVR